MNKFQKKNIRLLILGLIPVVIAIILILVSSMTGFLNNFSYWKEFRESALIGIIGGGIAALGVCLFIFRRILRYLSMDELINAVLKFIVKILQKFHIPLAMIGLAIISFHIYIFIHLGFKWTTGYIFGALAAIDLLILVISGILRIFNKGIGSHKVLGILFVILTALHVLLVK